MYTYSNWNSHRFQFACLLLIITFLSACSGAPSPTPITGAPLPLEDCQLSSPGSAQSVDARCGSLPVYEDQAARSGRKINLHVAVIPAVSRSPRGDALFLLAGGPGEAATASFPQFMSIFERIHQNRSIVLVDQRGTGKSNPLNCPTPPEELQSPSDEIDVQKTSELLKACAAQLQGDPRLYTTSAAVEDLEQVRQALGYQQIDLLGLSYGTRLAMAYLRQYPQRVRSVILDGVNPLDWELGPHNPANAQRTLDLIFARCAADPACHKAFPDLASEFSDLMAALDEQPLELSVPHPITGEMTPLKLTRNSVAPAIMLISYSPENAALLPLLIHTAHQRKDYSPLAVQYLMATGSLEEALSDGLYLSVLCAEDVAFYPATPPVVQSYLPAPLDIIQKECQAWPHSTVTPEFKQPVRSDVPVLILSGEADPVTPPENGEQVARTLTNRLHLVVPGMGHGQFYRGCMPKIITNFIESGSLDKLDTTCLQNIQPAPFFLNFSGPKP